YDALMTAKTKEAAAQTIADLDLEETELESFLRLGGQYYHTYPQLVKKRGQEFRTGTIKVVVAGEERKRKRRIRELGKQKFFLPFSLSPFHQFFLFTPVHTPQPALFPRIPPDGESPPRFLRSRQSVVLGG